MAKLSLNGAKMTFSQVRLLASMSRGVLDNQLMEQALVEKGVEVLRPSNEVVNGLIRLAKAGVDLTPILGFRLYPLAPKGGKDDSLPEFE